jgi:phosphoribosylpyrophosphate synthetase
VKRTIGEKTTVVAPDLGAVKLTREILQRLRLANIVATDSVWMDPAAPPPHLDICSVAPLLTTAIQRNHHDESLADLRASV